MDKQWMQQAIALSKKGMEENKGGPFGAIIVKNNKIIGKGCNQVTSHFDPTAHAEVVAIRNACEHEQDFSLKGATLYTSCEPCPMCLAAAYWARIDKIFFANSRDDAAFIGFDDAFLYNELIKPLEKRAIPMEQIERSSAFKVFTLWNEKSDKIPY